MKKMTITTQETKEFNTMMEYVEYANTLLSNESHQLTVLKVTVNKDNEAKDSFKPVTVWVNFKPIHNTLIFGTLFQIAYYSQVYKNLNSSLSKVKDREEKQMLTYVEKNYINRLEASLTELEEIIAYLEGLLPSNVSKTPSKTVEYIASIHSGYTMSLEGINDAVKTCKAYYEGMIDRVNKTEMDKLYKQCKTSLETCMNTLTWEENNFSWESKGHANGELTKQVTQLATLYYKGLKTNKFGKQESSYDTEGRTIASQIVRHCILSLECSMTPEAKVEAHKKAIEAKSKARQKKEATEKVA